MAFANVRLQTKEFTPADPATTETKALFNVVKGERVLWASAMPLIACDAGKTSAMVFGDGTATNGFIATFTNTQAASPIGTPIGGAGSLLAPSGGKLYTADDTVDVVFTADATSVTAPRVRFTIAVVREYPN